MSLDIVLLRDEFSDVVAAGSVNGTTATDGSLRTATDTESKASISSGSLHLASRTSATFGDPGVWYPVVNRSVGLVAYAVVVPTLTNTQHWIGFDTDTTGAPGAEALVLSSQTIIPRNAGVNGPVIGAYSVSAQRKLWVALRSAGAQFFADSTYPLLLWVSSSGNSATLRPVVATWNASADIDAFRIASSYLASPLVSHGFDSSVTTSDGNGHAETSGLGSGGSGIAMSGTTWSVSGGKGINTPTLGSELVTNGNFSSWTGDNPNSWDVTENGTTAFVTERAANQGNSGSGTGAANFYRNAGDTNPSIEQTILTIGKWYTVTLDRFSTSGYVSIADSSFGFGSPHTVGKNKTLRATATRLQIFSQGNPADNTIDNVSCKEIALSGLLSLHTLSTADVFSGIDLTVTTGTQAGVALNWDSSGSPANGVIAYHDGINAKLEKCVAGTWTSVISAAATYSANARLIVSKIGTAYRLYYNNALVGSGTIADAGIVNNTLHGLFSTYEGNTVDNYTCYASGAGGEYNDALQIVLSNERTTSMAMSEARAKTPVKIITDAVAFTDSVLRTVIKSEAVQMALGSAVIRVVTKAASDVFALSDSVLRTVIKYEVVQMALDSTTAKIAVKAFSDGVGFIRAQAIDYGKRIIRIIKLLGSTGAN